MLLLYNKQYNIITVSNKSRLEGDGERRIFNSSLIIIYICIILILSVQNRYIQLDTVLYIANVLLFIADMKI